MNPINLMQIDGLDWRTRLRIGWSAYMYGCIFHPLGWLGVLVQAAFALVTIAVFLLFSTNDFWFFVVLLVGYAIGYLPARPLFRRAGMRAVSVGLTKAGWCGMCGYPLCGLPQNGVGLIQCPECGAANADERSDPTGM